MTANNGTRLPRRHVHHGERRGPQEPGRGRRHQRRAGRRLRQLARSRTKPSVAWPSPAGNLYVGGAFTTPRRYALEVNATTGALIPALCTRDLEHAWDEPGGARGRRQPERHPGDPGRVLQHAEQRRARRSRTRPTSASARSMPPPERRSRGPGTPPICRRSDRSSCSRSRRTARRCSAPAPATAGRPCPGTSRRVRSTTSRASTATLSASAWPMACSTSADTSPAMTGRSRAATSLTPIATRDKLAAVDEATGLISR